MGARAPVRRTVTGMSDMPVCPFALKTALTIVPCGRRAPPVTCAFANGQQRATGMLIGYGSLEIVPMIHGQQNGQQIIRR
jgi:hypothetical protein